MTTARKVAAMKAPQTNRLEREAHLEWITLSNMRVSPLAQRELNKARVDKIAAHLDLEQLGTPTVNRRDGHEYIVDGQHRIRALEAFGFDGDYTIQCWTYVGLSEEEEAEKFLKLNDTLTVETFARFQVAIQAGREIEVDINRIVLSHDLRLSRDYSVDGSIRAVGTLRRIYVRSGAAVLSRTLNVAKNAYGQSGMESIILDGLAMLIGRYESRVDDMTLIERLSKAQGGAVNVAGRAEVMRQKTGKPKSQCVAAAMTEIYNGGRGGSKLTPWWKSED